MTLSRAAERARHVFGAVVGVSFFAVGRKMDFDGRGRWMCGSPANAGYHGTAMVVGLNDFKLRVPEGLQRFYGAPVVFALGASFRFLDQRHSHGPWRRNRGVVLLILLHLSFRAESTSETEQSQHYKTHKHYRANHDQHTDQV